MIAVLGVSPPVAAAFAIIFGGSNGLITIARGAVPLALFGASGYGRLMGRLAFPFLLVQSAAPLVMAAVIDGLSAFQGNTGSDIGASEQGPTQELPA